MYQDLSRKLIFFFLVASAPAFGEETYACFEAGVNDPEPEKLTIDGNFLLGPSMKGTYEAHTEDHFCSLSNSNFDVETGVVISSCFNRKDLRLFESFTLFGGFKNDDDDSSVTQNRTWRCIPTE